MSAFGGRAQPIDATPSATEITNLFCRFLRCADGTKCLLARFRATYASSLPHRFVRRGSYHEALSKNTIVQTLRREASR